MARGRAHLEGLVAEPNDGTIVLALIACKTHLYQPENEGGWEIQELRPPAYFGQPITDLADVGHLIADDPRFANCTARRFASWLGQIERDLVPAERVAEWGTRFSQSGFDAKALVADIVLSDDFLSNATDDTPGGFPALVARPEAYARTVESLTGFAWWVNPSDSCQTCGGDVDLLRSDLFGFRAMSGGVDGYLVTRPTHLPTATKALAASRAAELAASWVVEGDLSLPDGSRRLFAGIDLSLDDEAAVRSGLEVLHTRILGAPPEAIDTDEAWALFSAAHDEGRTTTECWKLATALLLQDPRLVVY